MEPKEKKAFEPTGLVPRSIVRTFERFRQQLLPGSERAAIREYRISRYQVLVSARCLFALLTIPIATNWFISSWLLSPLIEHFWNTQQNEIFLNSYQEERAFAELEFFSEKLFFESLLSNDNLNNSSLNVNQAVKSNAQEMVQHVQETKSIDSLGDAVLLAPQPFGASNKMSKQANLLPFFNLERQNFSQRSNKLTGTEFFISNKFGELFPYGLPHRNTQDADTLMVSLSDYIYGSQVETALKEVINMQTKIDLFKTFPFALDSKCNYCAPSCMPQRAAEQAARQDQFNSYDTLSIFYAPSLYFDQRSCMPLCCTKQERAWAGKQAVQGTSLQAEMITFLHAPKGCGASSTESAPTIQKKSALNVLNPSEQFIDSWNLNTTENSLKIKEKIQEKILELAVYYNQQTILSITNVAGDIISIFTLGCLFIWMKPEISILKSFLIEAIYSLSDTTKSFLLILLTDLLVGFHSPRGWETALEILLKHFGLPENQDFVFLFVATFPVLLDTVFKYWIFRHLNKISPSTVATYHSMIE